MTFLFALIAGQLGIGTAAATTVFNVIMKAGTLVTVLGILTSIGSGGATTLMTIGWAAFKAEVQRLAKKSMARAVAY